MQNLLIFLKSKSFLKQMVIVVIVWVIFSWIVLSLVGLYTHHGEKVLVPDFKGISKNSLGNFIADKDLRFEVIDSIFDLKAKKGAVADQLPKAGAYVKKNRIIYLTLNAVTPPKVRMPNLIDLTLRQATARIETYGLKIGRIQSVPDLAKNAVLRQLIGSREMKPGDLVNKGSVVNLVVGSGLGEDEIYIPNLVGYTRSEAIGTIVSSNLTVGSVIFDAATKDTSTAQVYKQLPAFRADVRLNSGHSVDIFLTNDPSKLQKD